jgi:hypothetical protein
MSAPHRHDRIVECKGPAEVRHGDVVTFVRQRPDGSRYDQQYVFHEFDAGRRFGEDAA